VRYIGGRCWHTIPPLQRRRNCVASSFNIQAVSSLTEHTIRFEVIVIGVSKIKTDPTLQSQKQHHNNNNNNNNPQTSNSNNVKHYQQYGRHPTIDTCGCAPAATEILTSEEETRQPRHLLRRRGFAGRVSLLQHLGLDTV